MPLSRQDVIFGRALLSWKLVDRTLLMACAQVVEAFAAQGRPVTLGQVLVERGLLSVDRYQAIVARLREVYVQSPSAPAQVRQATEEIPFMSATGRYTRSFRPTQVTPGEETDTLERQAVAAWAHRSADVVADERPSEPPDDAVIRERLGVPPGQGCFEIGGWTVENSLGVGNFGIVYRVTRGGQGPYALKVLKALNASEQVRQRFIQEARTMAKLRHPAIVHVHNAGVEKGLLWYAMELLRGPDLEQILLEQGKLPVAQTLDIMTRICDAVAYAHSQAVLHRDLKPENVIMAGGTRPYLTDFGLAKDFESEVSLTVDGQRIGTPLYMSLELLTDEDGATPRSEVYSLGAMLYQCLTGQPPYEANGIFELLQKLEQNDATPLTQLCPEAPQRLEAICRRALHKSPAERHQTVAELGADLAACV